MARADALRYDTVMQVLAESTAFEIHANKPKQSTNVRLLEGSPEVEFAQMAMKAYGVTEKLPPGTNRNTRTDGDTPTDVERAARWLCHNWEEVPELSMLWRVSLTARACAAYDPAQNTRTLEIRTYYTSELLPTFLYKYTHRGSPASAIVQFGVMGGSSVASKHANFASYASMSKITEPGAMINAFLKSALAGSGGT